MKISKKAKNHINFLIKFFISVLALVYIIKRLLSIPVENYTELYLKINQNSKIIFFIISIFILLFCNLLVEAYKWKYLLCSIEKITIKKSFFSVLAGNTFGVFTPNRVGELIGRTLSVGKTNPLKVLLLSSVGSISQLLVTWVVGSISLVIFYFLFLQKTNFYEKYPLITVVAIVIIVVFCIGFVLFYFNFKFIKKVLFIFPKSWQNKINMYASEIYSISKSKLTKVFLLSLFRYLIFMFQYFLCFKVCSLSLESYKIILIIPLIYLGLALIPVFSIADIGIRGSIATILVALSSGYSVINVNISVEISVLMASTLIWLINIAIPAIMGIFVVFKLKILKS